ncbi:MAG: TPR end-of-group domain-containing protein, partial [Leadbetterella sp.]
YALSQNKNEALEYLKIALGNNEIPYLHVLEDQDWDFYKEDPDFLELDNKYKK